MSQNDTQASPAHIPQDEPTNAQSTTITLAPSTKKPLRKHTKILLLIFIPLFCCCTPLIGAALYKNAKDSKQSAKPQLTEDQRDVQSGGKPKAAPGKILREAFFFPNRFSDVIDGDGNASSLAFILSCESDEDEESCDVTAPRVAETFDTSVAALGYTTEPESNEVTIEPGATITLSDEESYFYLVSTKTINITYAYPRAGTTDQQSCTIYSYEQQDDCDFQLPYYKQAGTFENTWKIENDAVDRLYKSGEIVTIDSDTTFVAIYRHAWCAKENDSDCDQEYRFRDLNIQRTETVGETTFEYEAGIPSIVIDNHVKFIKEAFVNHFWVFTPAKVFVLTPNTYERISIAYGLTFGPADYNYIDIQWNPTDGEVENYGSKLGAISENATIHELAHAWDSYYSYRTGKGRIHEQQDVIDFFNKLQNQSEQKVLDLSIVEWFAGVSTEYYWHYLGANPNKPSYAGYRDQMTDAEKAEFVQIYERYVNFAKNNYQ